MYDVSEKHEALDSETRDMLINEMQVDVQPYYAIPISEQMIIEENGDIGTVENIMNDLDSEKMSVDELLMTDSELTEYRAEAYIQEIENTNQGDIDLEMENLADMAEN